MRGERGMCFAIDGPDGRNGPDGQLRETERSEERKSFPEYTDLEFPPMSSAFSPVRQVGFVRQSRQGPPNCLFSRKNAEPDLKIS